MIKLIKKWWGLLIIPIVLVILNLLRGRSTASVAKSEVKESLTEVAETLEVIKEVESELDSVESDLDSKVTEITESIKSHSPPVELEDILPDLNKGGKKK